MNDPKSFDSDSDGDEPQLVDLGQDNIFSADYLLSTAWRDLDELFNSETFQSDKSFRYLLGLWSSFSIYQLEPDPLPKQSVGQENEESRSPLHYTSKVIHLKGGWKVLDFGEGLITSAGENYGSYSTGPLLRTIEYMLLCLLNRGAKEVIFSGCSLPAKRFAWVLCNHHGIKTSFNPKEADFKCQQRIESIRQGRYPFINSR